MLPIPGLLDDEPFDGETKRIIRLAFEAARVAIDPQGGHHGDATLANRSLPKRANAIPMHFARRRYGASVWSDYDP